MATSVQQPQWTRKWTPVPHCMFRKPGLQQQRCCAAPSTADDAQMAKRQAVQGQGPNLKMPRQCSPCFPSTD